MFTQTETIQLSLEELTSLGELAERSSIPWAAWAERGEVYAVFGGGRSPVVEADTSANNPQENNQSDQLARPPLASEITALRFQTLRERDVKSSGARAEPNLWPSWGAQGFTWRPQYSIRFTLSNGRGLIGARAPQAVTRLNAQKSRRDARGASRVIKESAIYNALIDDLLTQSVDHSVDHNGEALSAEAPLSGLVNDLVDEDFGSWASRVEDVVTRCDRGEWEKVVIARALSRESPRGTQWSGAKLWRMCCDQAESSEVPFILAPSPHEQFVGRSPELLFEMSQSEVKTHALAGTRVKPQTTGPTLGDLEAELVQSEKDQEEHQLVVSWISRQLASICDEVDVGPQRIRSAGHLIHLETPISGVLSSEVSAVKLLRHLHPTPALGGVPRKRTLEYIRETEPLDRGGYAAPWAWTDESGVSTAVVGIRAALLKGTHARLYAGAGIVAGSIAIEEWRETSAKSETLGRSLNAAALRPLPREARERSLPTRSLQRSINLIETLSLSGVAGAVISPGSRNTPLALALDSRLSTIISVDERSAGFIALGWARATGRPVVLCCTSGSAGAHYLPAITEAYYAGVPLLILTADRPPRLRGRGAPQTMWQHGLYGHHVKWDAELPEELESGLQFNELSALWSLLGARATHLSLTAPCGPVHLNVPFEEPLWDEGCEALLEGERQRAQQGHASWALSPPLSLPISALSASLLGLDLSVQEGVICCGPLSPSRSPELIRALERLSLCTGWPLLAEGSSQLRSARGHIASFELLARAHYAGELTGELRDTMGGMTLSPPAPSEVRQILFVGGHTHSRLIRRWLSDTKAQSFWVGESPEVSDPLELGVIPLGSDLRLIAGALDHSCERLEAVLHDEASTEWAHRWRSFSQRARHAHREGLAEASREGRGGLWGGGVGDALLHALEASVAELSTGQVAERSQPADIVVASSMAFRDHDLTWRPSGDEQLHAVREARVWVNRGLNGIDGTFSTALGIARAQHDIASHQSARSTPLVIWIGDLAAHHDLQGLHGLCRWHHQAQSARPIVILLTNNEGGGIFYHLPISGSARFQDLFVTPIHPDSNASSQTEWSSVAHWAGAKHDRVSNLAELRARLESGLLLPQVSLVEITLNAELDKRRHQEYWSAALNALSSPLSAPLSAPLSPPLSPLTLSSQRER